MNGLLGDILKPINTTMNLKTEGRNELRQKREAHLVVRMEPAQKQIFETRCEELLETPSSMIRKLIARFLKESQQKKLEL